MLKIIFRVDGNSRIGIGHVMRCLALSEEIKRRCNCDIIFLMKNSETGREEVSKRGYKIVTELPKEFMDMIITDLPKIDQDYLLTLKKKTKLLVSIDDSTETHYCSDIVVKGSIVPKLHNYEPTSLSQFLIGAKFMILDKKFQKFNEMNKKINPVVKSILITLGGSDINNLTLKVANALNKLNNNITKTVVIGPAFKRIDKWELELNENYDLKYAVSNMAELMFSSDIAIAGGGITLHELAAVGTPGIILCQTEKQLMEANYFEKEGAFINLGVGKSVTKEMITSAVMALMKDRKKRMRMSVAGKKLVDAKGVDRVINKIFGGDKNE